MASLMLTLAVKPRHHTPRQFPATLEGGGDASVYLPARRASLLVDTCPVSFRLLQLEEAKKLQLEEARLRSLRLSRRGMHAGFQYAAARHNAAPACSWIRKAGGKSGEASAKEKASSRHLRTEIDRHRVSW